MRVHSYFIERTVGEDMNRVTSTRIVRATTTRRALIAALDQLCDASDAMKIKVTRL